MLREDVKQDAESILRESVRKAKEKLSSGSAKQDSSSASTRRFDTFNCGGTTTGEDYPQPKLINFNRPVSNGNSETDRESRTVQTASHYEIERLRE